MTPRIGKNGVWRVGAIFVDPDHRGKEIGSEALISFFKDRKASDVPIDIDNKDDLLAANSFIKKK